MPLLKVDSSHPQAFFEVLKQLNILEGAELEIEQVQSGVLLKPVVSGQERIRIALLNPFINGQDQRKEIDQLALEMQKIGIAEDSSDLDSDWWIKTIERGSSNYLKDISMDDE